MAILKKYMNNKCGEKGTSHTVVGNTNCAATVENSIEVPQKTKTRIPIRPSNPTPGIYPDKVIIQKDPCTPMFIAALFTIAKIWKEPKCLLTDEWINKT